MRRWSGFTIVELVVVMVIMAILLTLASFSISGSQANARDNQRNTDVAIIARGLETRYKEGNPRVTAPSYVTPGSYPDINEMAHIIGGSNNSFLPNQVVGGYSNDALPGTSVESFSPPGAADTPYAGFIIASCSGTCSSANDSSASGSAAGSAVTKSQFYYEPIDANGKICSGVSCVRYNLYWHTEVDNTSHVLRSKRQ